MNIYIEVLHREEGDRLGFECYFQHTLFDQLDSRTPEAAGGAPV